jgi:hypothetical protein
LYRACKPSSDTVPENLQATVVGDHSGFQSTMGLPQNILRGSFRSLPIPHCLHLHLHLQQPQPLISLRHFSAQYAQTSVLVRSQRSSLAERAAPAAAPSFEQLGLGPELLTFLQEHNLQTPTEIQVRASIVFLHLYKARTGKQARAANKAPGVLQQRD